MMAFVIEGWVGEPSMILAEIILACDSSRMFWIKKTTQFAYAYCLVRMPMKNVASTLVLLFFASSLAGCVTTDEDRSTDQDSRIADLEESQLE